MHTREPVVVDHLDRPRHESAPGSVAHLGDLTELVADEGDVAGEHALVQPVEPPPAAVDGAGSDATRPAKVLGCDAVLAIAVLVAGEPFEFCGQVVVVLVGGGQPVLECRGLIGHDLGCDQMQPAPFRWRNVLVDRRADEGMRQSHRQARVCGALEEQFACGELCRGIRRRVHLGDHRDVRQSEPPRAEHRRRPQQPHGGRRELVHPRAQTAGELGGGGEHPHPAQLGAIVLTQQRRQIERIAPGVLPEVVRHIARQTRMHLRDEIGGEVEAQARELQPAHVGR